MEKANDTKAGPDISASAMAAAMEAVSPVAGKVWVSCLSEISQFLTERVKQDLDTQKAMMACQSPAAVLKLQADFFTTAMEQYSECSRRLFKTLSTTNPLQGVGSGHSRRYDDLPL